jgi:hypothetical protein
MPYTYKKVGNKYCVYKKEDNTKVGCTKKSIKKYLSALYANVDESNQIKGGKADKLSIKDIAKKFNISVDDIKKQLEKGVSVEKEHTPNEDKAKEIAKDHLSEIPDYYDRLDKMEKTAKKKYNLNEIVKKKLNFYLTENLSDIGELHPNVKKNEIPPILLTWNEYYKIVNENDKEHPSSAYNRSYDKNDTFNCGDGDCKTIKNKTVGNLLLKFILKKEKVQYAKWDGEKYLGVYSEDELMKLGKSSYIYSIYCTHNNIVVGKAIDEWGCVLISVVKEFRSLGIGEELIKMYRKIYPYKPSGGLTSSGYAQLRKYYNHMVKEAQSNGVYSDLIKRGELDKKRFYEIINSVSKEKFSDIKTNKLKDIYGVKNEPIYIIDDNLVIIFDSKIKDINDESISEIDDEFLKDLIYCYIYVNEFNNYPQVLNCYGNDKYIKQGIEILASLNKDYGGLGDYYFRNFTGNVKTTLEDIWNDDNKYIIEVIKDGGYISSIPLTLIKPKKPINNVVKQLQSISKLWFKKNDKYDELYNRIHEFAYGLLD